MAVCNTEALARAWEVIGKIYELAVKAYFSILGIDKNILRMAQYNKCHAWN